MHQLHLYPIGLKSIREYRRLPLKDAAALIDMKPTSYARFESGTRRIYFNAACTLADALRCTLDDLRRTWTDDELFARFGPYLEPAAMPQVTDAERVGTASRSRELPPPPPQPVQDQLAGLTEPSPPPPPPADDIAGIVVGGAGERGWQL